MEITISQQTGSVPVTVLHVKGQVGVESYQQLEKEADACLAGGTTCLLLDLGGVTFLSSSGLRAIHHIFEQVRASQPEGSDKQMRAGMRDGTYHSSHLKLANPSQGVLAVLKTAGFDMFLEIYPNVEKAVASF
ncbi:MAG: STAS domain-containing protein [Anaerolineae bacterium]